MDIIIVCHTEFGFVYHKKIVNNKNALDGVKKGVTNLIKIGDKYKAKITFAVCPEVVEYFPRNIKHEIGLHIHPGWKAFQSNGFNYYVGDAYLRNHCKQSLNSTVLRDYPFEEQLEMIKTGKEHLEKELSQRIKVFVAGRWSLNNDTIKALIETGFTHDCSAPAHSKANHHNWSKLPRICMPYRPNEKDYQKKGDLPFLIVPISQYFPHGNVNPEITAQLGLSWLKACFLEYYKQNLPLFHICLHSPCMTNSYFLSAMDELLKFISKYPNVKFKFASEINKYPEINSKTNIIPYIFALNKNILRTFLRNKIVKIKAMAKKMNKKRWKIAQKYEKDYWNYVKSKIAERDKKEIKKYWNWYLKFIKDYIDIKQETKILEIGCGGDGIINYIDKGEKYALDPLMDYFRSNFELPKEIRWLKGVGEDIPFKNDYFDIIIIANTLDHTNNPERVLNEIKRVLKKQGFLLLTADCHQPFLKNYRRLKELFNIGDKLHPYSFSVKDVMNLIKKAGIDVLFVHQGIGNLGKYIIKESIVQELTFYEKTLSLLKERGVKALIDAGISKILRLAGKKLIGEENKIDFVFIAKKR